MIVWNASTVATRSGAVCVAAAILAAGCRVLPPEQQVVHDASQALGGTELLLSITAIELRGTGTYWEVGQPPGASSTPWTLTGFHRTIVFCCGNTLPFTTKSQMAVQRTRTAPAPSGSVRTVRHEVVLDGDAAWETAGAGAPAPVSEARAREHRVDMLHHPISVVRAALEHHARASGYRQEGGELLADITTAGGDTVTLGIDNATKLPTRVRSAIDHPILGRVTRETVFSDYERINEELWMPRRLTERIGGRTVADIVVSENAAGGNVGSGMRALPTGRVSVPGRGGRGGQRGRGAARGNG